jgi:dGTPase
MEAFDDEFDHNRHALRIVETFEQRYARFPGLNLTFEVREGIVKHSRDLDPHKDAALAAYLPDLRPPLEAQLIDLADEIAYNTGDLDDGYSAGLLPIDEITERIPHYREILDAVEMQYPGADERVRFHEALRLLIDYLVTGLIEGTVRAADESGVADSAGVREHPHRLARFTEPAAEAEAALKRLLHERVYRTEPLVAARRRSRGMIAELFAFYLESPDRMPSPYRTLAAHAPPHRIVCDYIAGMTDSFFVRTYAQLFGTAR